VRSHWQWFWLACAAEAARLGLASLLGWWLRIPVLAQIHAVARDVLVGALAAVPLLAVFLWTLHSSLRPFAEVRGFLEERIRPFFATWSLFELLCISLVAGVSEEALFRGFLQGSLAGPLGQPLAILLTSLAFGAAHPITPAYFVIATLIGAVMSGLWLSTGNLLTPIATHAVYDFAALTYLLRGWSKAGQYRESPGAES
jgi:hypothetical protein